MQPDTFTPESASRWHEWLKINDQTSTSVWLIFHKKSSGKPTLSWSEAVDEALCFGWVDSRRKTIDEHSFIQFFCQRKPKSTWSKINKAKVEILRAQNRIQPAGQRCIDIAMANGAWNILNEIEEIVIPDDLQQALQNHCGKEMFDNFSRSSKKAMLQWVSFAKRPETRKKRIDEIAVLAAQNKKPKPFQSLNPPWQNYPT